MIRLARAGDLELMRDIERAAGEPFRALGMDAIADDDLPTVAELAKVQEAGRAWVVTDDADVAVGYVLVDIVDKHAHVEQVSVHPRYARQGLGRRLLDTVAEWARHANLRGMTLTTFADVPWNAPYYRRLGWTTIDEADLTPGLTRIVERETAHGLNRWPRVAMRRKIT